MKYLIVVKHTFSTQWLRRARTELCSWPGVFSGRVVHRGHGTIACLP